MIGFDLDINGKGSGKWFLKDCAVESKYDTIQQGICKAPFWYFATTEDLIHKYCVKLLLYCISNVCIQ